MAFHGILIQSDQQVQMVAVRINFLFANAHPQPDVAAADDGLIAVVGVDVESGARDTFRQSVARFVQSVTCGAPDSNGDLTRHGNPPGCVEAANTPGLAPS